MCLADDFRPLPPILKSFISHFSQIPFTSPIPFFFFRFSAVFHSTLLLDNTIKFELAVYFEPDVILHAVFFSSFFSLPFLRSMLSFFSKIQAFVSIFNLLSC